MAEYVYVPVEMGTVGGASVVDASPVVSRTGYEFTAEGGGKFVVFRNGVPYSSHVQEREAIENAIEALVEAPGSDVWYERHYRVRVMPKIYEIQLGEQLGALEEGLASAGGAAVAAANLIVQSGGASKVLETQADGVGAGSAEENLPPDQPTLVSVVVGVSDVTLSGSAFSDSNANDVHVSSQWQIALASDPNFDTPVYDSGDSADLTEHVVDQADLPDDTDLLARVRYSD